MVEPLGIHPVAEEVEAFLEMQPLCLRKGIELEPQNGNVFLSASLFNPQTLPTQRLTHTHLDESRTSNANLSCSVALKKGTPFWGSPLLVGQPPNKRKKNKRVGATEELRNRRNASQASRTGTLRSGDLRASSPCLLSRSRMRLRAFQGLGIQYSRGHAEIPRRKVKWLCHFFGEKDPPKKKWTPKKQRVKTSSFTELPSHHEAFSGRCVPRSFKI